MNNEDDKLYEDNSSEENINYGEENNNDNDIKEDNSNNDYTNDTDMNSDYNYDNETDSTNPSYDYSYDDEDDYSSSYTDDSDSGNDMMANIKKYAVYGLILIVCIIAFLIFVSSFSSGSKKSSSSVKKVTLEEGDKIALEHKAESYTWNSSNKDVAIVTEDGQIEALSVGDTVITVKVDGNTYKTNVHVKESSIVITSLDIDKEEIILKVDDTFQLNASTVPENAKQKEITWHSSNEKTVTVDSTGKVTAKAIGSSTIMAKTRNGNMDICIVRVVSSEVEDDDFEKIVFDVNSVVLKADVKYTLDYSIEPKEAKVKLDWESSDPTVATVEDGVIKTLAPGTVSITARKANKEATLYVTVVKGDSSTPDVISDGKGNKAVSINLNQTELNMKLGSSFKLVAEVLPSDTADKTVSFASEDESIAKVDTTGVVTAKALGETKIVVTAASGISEEVTILVTENGGNYSIENITLSISNVTLAPGNELQLVGTYSPSNANPEDLIWESSDNNVATVKDGYVTAVGPGTAKITVSNGNGVSTSCNITVSSSGQTLERITINPASLSLRVNGTTQLTVSFFPANASNKTIVWKSSNRSIATVDSNGMVTGKKAGHAVIYATTSNGIVATASVTVQ